MFKIGQTLTSAFRSTLLKKGMFLQKSYHELHSYTEFTRIAPRTLHLSPRPLVVHPPKSPSPIHSHRPLTLHPIHSPSQAPPVQLPGQLSLSISPGKHLPPTSYLITARSNSWVAPPKSVFLATPESELKLRDARPQRCSKARRKHALFS